MDEKNDKQRIIEVLQSVVDNVITDRCCSTCSTSGIPDGSYAYFHIQDQERAFSADGVRPVEEESRPRYDWDVDDGGLDADDYSGAVREAGILVAPLYIGYGNDKGDETVTTVRMAIHNALNAAGFVVQDTGTNDKRLCIEAVTTTRVLA